VEEVDTKMRRPMTWRERMRALALWLNRLLEKGYGEADVATGC
jgi:hypothetical protein